LGADSGVNYMEDDGSDLVREAKNLGLEYGDEGILYYPGRIAVGAIGKPLRKLPIVREKNGNYEVVKRGLLRDMIITVESPRLALFILLHLWARDIRRGSRGFISRILRTAYRIASKSRLGDSEACRDLYRRIGCRSGAKLLAASISLYSIARYEAFRDPLEPSLKYLMGRRLIHRIREDSLAFLPSSLAIITRLLSSTWKNHDTYVRKASKLVSKVVSTARRDYFYARSGWLLAKSLASGTDIEKLLPLGLTLALAGHIRGPFVARLDGFEPLQPFFTEIALLLGKTIKIEAGTPVEAASTVLSLDSGYGEVHVVHPTRLKFTDRSSLEEWTRPSDCRSGIEEDKILVTTRHRETIKCLEKAIAMGLGVAIASNGSYAVIKPLEGTSEVLIYKTRRLKIVDSLLEALKVHNKPCSLEPIGVQRRLLLRGSLEAGLGNLLECKRS